MKSLVDCVYVKLSVKYHWDDPGIVRLRDGIAALQVGDLSGRVLLYCHGNGEDCRSGRFLFEELAGRGISVLSVDYRGYGLSGGRFSEKGCFEAAHAGYDWLRARGKASSDIIAWGYSLGSCPAIELAATENVGGLILQTPLHSGFRLAKFHARRMLGRWGWVAGFARFLPGGNAFPSVRFAKDVHCPVLAFHGTWDFIVPYADGKELFGRIASGNKRLITVPGGGHNDFQSVMGWAKYVDELVSFAQSATDDGSGKVDVPCRAKR